jgi:hypothetical protein
MRAWWAEQINYLEKRTRWAGLRALGNSGLVRSSVLMPVFGYMLLFNDKIREYLTVPFDGALLQYLPPEWRVWFLFYGAFFVAIASLLYAWRCPPEVKRFGTPMDYVASDTNYHLAQNRFSDDLKHIDSLYSELPQWQRELRQLKDFKPSSRVLAPHAFAKGEEATSVLTSHLSFFWEMKNITRWELRMFIGACFLVGILLLTIPAAFTFLQVTIVLVKRLFW